MADFSSVNIADFFKSQPETNTSTKMQQWGNSQQPVSTTEQLLPLVQSGEYNAPYAPMNPVEKFLDFGQNAETAIGGTYEAHMVREGLKKFGPAALKSIVTSPAKVLMGVAVDAAIPNRVNDMDENKMIKNYKGK
jgi:hypothetical protein